MRKLAVEADILNLLRGADGVTTHDVAERLAISISTASKYLEALRRERRVLDTPVGPAKIWRLCEDMESIGEFEGFKKNLTRTESGAVRLFDQRAAILPAAAYGALVRRLEKEDAKVAQEALCAMGEPLGAHATRIAAERTKAVGTELLRTALTYLNLKGWGKHDIVAFEPTGPKLTVRMVGPLGSGVAQHRKPVHHVTAGAMKGVFEAVTGVPGAVEERRCKNAGDAYCEFLVVRA